MPIIDTLANTSIRDITETFNLAFSDYSVPIVFREEQLAYKLESEGGRLDLSVGIFHEDSLVAFILHFVDVRDGLTYVYNGGTGVVPNHRGQQLTSKMYDFILPILEKSKVNRMILEVFTNNFTASKIYQHQGFEIQREVACYNGELKKRSITLNNEYELFEMQEPNWELFSSFWDFPPTWQNGISTLSRIMDRLLFLAVRNENEVLGYLIFNKEAKRIHHLAVRLEYRSKGIGSALLNAVLELERDKVSFMNIDTRTRGMLDFLKKRGLTTFVNQFEMEAQL